MTRTQRHWTSVVMGVLAIVCHGVWQSSANAQDQRQIKLATNSLSRWTVRKDFVFCSVPRTRGSPSHCVVTVSIWCMACAPARTRSIECGRASTRPDLRGCRVSRDRNDETAAIFRQHRQPHRRRESRCITAGRAAPERSGSSSPARRCRLA